MWQNSPGHNANLLLPPADSVGVAVARNNETQYKTFWAMVIADKSPKRKDRKAGVGTSDNATVEAASRAFERGPWSKMTPSGRGKIMRRIAQLIEQHAEYLGQVEVRDNGKLISEMVAQTKYMPEWFYYYGGLADKIQGTVVTVDRPDHFNY